MKSIKILGRIGTVLLLTCLISTQAYASLGNSVSLGVRSTTKSPIAGSAGCSIKKVYTPCGPLDKKLCDFAESFGQWRDDHPVINNIVGSLITTLSDGDINVLSPRTLGGNGNNHSFPPRPSARDLENDYFRFTHPGAPDWYGMT